MKRIVLIPVLAVGLSVFSACGSDGKGGNGDPNIQPGPGPHQRMFIPRIVPDDGSDEIWRYMQRATIFWFGRVNSADNYTDARVGYNDHLVMIRCAVFDQKIYEEAQDDALDQWDSITLMVDLDGDDDKTAIDERSFRIDAQAHRHGTERTVIYQGSAGGWAVSGIQPGTSPEDTPDAINLSKGYRGEGRDESRGWVITFYLGFQALGLAGPPLGPDERNWRVAVISYDRDNMDGTEGGEPQYWPTPSLDTTDPSTWGRWEFLDGHFLSRSESGSTSGTGQPAYAILHTPDPYQVGTEETIVVRNGLDGDVVENASVGASDVLCSGDDSYNFGDGPDSWGGNTERNYFHIQNQADVADWPCFARAYVKFPLAKLPPDRVTVSARLILHHKQPTSGGNEGVWSLIQAFPVANTLIDGQTPWSAANINFNNAPLAFENVAGTWVDRAGLDLGWDNLPELSWDVTRAVATAPAGASHISFALTSADTDYHTGKELANSADFEDWGDPTQRPTLEIVTAQPQ